MSVKRRMPFTPTPTQKEFLDSTDKQILLSGSFGAGKSRIGCEKGYLLNCKYPGNRGLIVRNTYTDVRASTIEQTLMEEVIPDSHVVDHHQTSHKIRHRTGTRGENGEPVTSEIQYHGLDSGSSSDGLPTKIGGQQYGWIFVDEGIEISKGAWVQLLGRLRYTGREQSGKKYKIPFRQIFTATNPASKTHWMYKWFFEDEKGKWFKMTAHELAKHVPDIPSDYVSTMAESYEGMYYDRYVAGEWVASQGLVYNEYDSHKHKRTVDELPGDWSVKGRVDYGSHTFVRAVPPEYWRVFRSIDFGYRAPFICQWWAYDPEANTHVLFREIYKTETLMEDHAERIKELSKELEIEQSYADPAQAEDRQTLQRHGVMTEKAKKDISAGIQEVKSCLNHEDGEPPQLMFLDGSLAHLPDDSLGEENKPTRTLDEITEYQWKDDKEEPDGGDDHGMDAMRYYIYSRANSTSWTAKELKEMENMFNEGF